MDAQWVEVRSCSFLHEAEFLKSVLDAAGIESQIPDEYALGVQPGIATFGNVRLLVRAGDLERATEVLDSPAEQQAAD